MPLACAHSHHGQQKETAVPSALYREEFCRFKPRILRSFDMNKTTSLIMGLGFLAVLVAVCLTMGSLDNARKEEAKYRQFTHMEKRYLELKIEKMEYFLKLHILLDPNEEPSAGRMNKLTEYMFTNKPKINKDIEDLNSVIKRLGFDNLIKIPPKERPIPLLEPIE